MFSIVKFLDSNTVDIAPTCWYNEGVISWPNYKFERLKRAVKRSEAPDSDSWAKFDASLVKTFDTYEQAQRSLPKAQFTSDLSESDDVITTLSRPQRSTAKPIRIRSDSSDEMDESLVVIKNLPTTSLSYGLPTPPIYEADDPVQLTVTTAPPLTLQIDSGVQEEGDTSQHFAPKDSQVFYITNNGSENFSCGNPSTERFQRSVIDTLTEIKLSLRQLNLKVDKLSEQTLKSRPSKSLQLHSLPLGSIDEVNNLNVEIKSNSLKRQALVETIRFTGGTTCKEAVRHAINKLMTKEVSVKYSAAGAKGKLKFNDLEFRSVICDALRSRSELTDVTEKAICDEITSYLPRISDALKYHQKKKVKM